MNYAFTVRWKRAQSMELIWWNIIRAWFEKLWILCANLWHPLFGNVMRLRPLYWSSQKRIWLNNIRKKYVTISNWKPQNSGRRFIWGYWRHITINKVFIFITYNLDFYTGLTYFRYLMITKHSNVKLNHQSICQIVCLLSNLLLFAHHKTSKRRRNVPNNRIHRNPEPIERIISANASGR